MAPRRPAPLRWASELADVPAILPARPDLREAMQLLLAHREIPIKVTEGGDRRARRKAILDALFAGTLTVDDAIAEVERQLGPGDSPHATNTKVFCKTWPARLVRTHLSVFYNWAVLEWLLASGAAECFVPHVPAESPDSRCARELAGRVHATVVLRDRLIRQHVTKRPAGGALVPEHPSCSHVVAPAPSPPPRG